MVKITTMEDTDDEARSNPSSPINSTPDLVDSAPNSPPTNNNSHANSRRINKRSNRTHLELLWSTSDKEPHPSTKLAPLEYTTALTAKKDLKSLLKKVQYHNCAANPKNCYKKCRAGEPLICAYKFPKPITTETKFVDIRKANDKVKLDVEYKRNHSMINNHNVLLIRAWRGNMDIQFVGDAYGASFYTVYYASKSEPIGNFLRHIRNKFIEIPANCDLFVQLKQVAYASLTAHSYSKQEGIWNIKGYVYAEVSRTIINLNVLPPDRRANNLLPREFLETMEDNNENISGGILNILNNFEDYKCRPVSEEHQSLFEWRSWWNYTPNEPNKNRTSLRLQDQKGWVVKRNKAAVINPIPRFKMDLNNEDCTYAILTMYTNWRIEGWWLEQFGNSIEALKGLADRLPHNISTIIEKMIKLDETQNDMRTHHTQNQNRAQPTNESQGDRERNPWQEFETEIDTSIIPTEAGDFPSRRTYTEEEIEIARTFVENRVSEWEERMRDQRVTNYTNNGEETEDFTQLIEDLSKNLNDDQLRVFEIVRLHFEIQKKGQNRQLQMIISGEGGTGKSFTIQAITKLERNYWSINKLDQRGKYGTVLLMAPTGVAAYNIGGRTIHSVLMLGANSIKEVTDKLRTDLQTHFLGIKLVIIDEFSMISTQLLETLDTYLRAAFPKFKELPFGGVNIIFLGDFYQLPPVGGIRLYSDSKQTGRSIWKDINDVVILRKQERQSGDNRYAEILSRVRTNSCTLADIQTLNTRAPPHLLSVIDYATYYTNRSILFCIATNKDAKEINKNNLNTLRGPIVHCWAQHAISLSEIQSKLHQIQDDLIEGHTEQSAHKITGLPALHKYLLERKEQKDDWRMLPPQHLKLAVGARVMLTNNIGVGVGLVNSSIGVIYDVLYEKSIAPRFRQPFATKQMATSIGPQLQLPIVLVQFDEQFYNGISFLADVPQVVPIFPAYMRFYYNRRSLWRIQIPLKLASCVTIHKTQGLTLNELATDLSTTFERGQAYVVISRVKSLQTLHLAARITGKEFALKPEDMATVTREQQRLNKLDENTKVRYQRYISNKM